MPSLGLGELILIGIVLLVVVGPERLPHATRWLGRLYGQMRRAADELRRALVLEADRLDEEDRLKDLRKRREDALQRRREAEVAAGEGTASQQEPGVPEEPEATEEQPPPGFSMEEWSELPEHIREIVRRRGSET